MAVAYNARWYSQVVSIESIEQKAVEKSHYHESAKFPSCLCM